MPLKYKVQSKRSRNILKATVWCVISSYRQDEVLLVISTSKFFRGWTMQFGRRGATIGRDDGFCITIMHRATHRSLCSCTSPRKTFLSSPTTVLCGSRSEWVLAVPYSENLAQAGDLVTLEDIKSNVTTEFRKISKDAFFRCFQQWQDR
jgi:hypothetical protein